jgi:hypothetical protein
MLNNVAWTDSAIEFINTEVEWYSLLDFPGYVPPSIYDHDCFYVRANNRFAWLEQILNIGDTTLVTEDTWLGDISSDRSLPKIEDRDIMLVLWGRRYPNPSADPNREIVIARWSGTGFTWNTTYRGVGGTEENTHYIGDNVALIYTAEMSWEICIFDNLLRAVHGSIAYTDDLDSNGCCEVYPLVPDNEVSEEGYKKILVTGGSNQTIFPYWQFVWATEVGGKKESL